MKIGQVLPVTLLLIINIDLNDDEEFTGQKELFYGILTKLLKNGANLIVLCEGTQMEAKPTFIVGKPFENFCVGLFTISIQT